MLRNVALTDPCRSMPPPRPSSGWALMTGKVRCPPMVEFTTVSCTPQTFAPEPTAAFCLTAELPRAHPRGAAAIAAMWSRRVALLASLTVSMVPAPSHATFHDAVINEVMAGVGGTANAQFVEIRMLAGFQNAVAGSRLTWFNCTFTSCQVLMQVGPFNVPNSGPGVTWLMGSPNDAMFSAATGVHADYYWDNAVTGNLDPSCGMVCWGAPGVVVPNPATWDPGEPNNYTDCVAYGGYTGRRKTLPSYLGGPATAHLCCIRSRGRRNSVATSGKPWPIARLPASPAGRSLQNAASFSARAGDPPRDRS